MYCTSINIRSRQDTDASPFLKYRHSLAPRRYARYPDFSSILSHSINLLVCYFFIEYLHSRAITKQWKLIPTYKWCQLWHRTCHNKILRPGHLGWNQLVLQGMQNLLWLKLSYSAINNYYDPNKLNKSKTYENPSRLNRLQFTIVKLYVTDLKI